MNVWNATRAALSFRNNEEEVVKAGTLTEWVSGFQEVRIFTARLIFTNTYGSKMIKESFQLYSHGRGKKNLLSLWFMRAKHTQGHSPSRTAQISKHNNKVKNPMVLPEIWLI